MQGSTCHWNGRAVCVAEAQGIVKEAKMLSEPAALVVFFEALGFAVKPIGLEAGPLSQWLHAGLKRAGFEAVLLETACEGGLVSNDGEDRPLRCARACPTDPDGLVPPGAHAKSRRSQEVRSGQATLERIAGAMLSARAARF